MKPGLRKLLFAVPVITALFAVAVYADSNSSNFESFTTGSVDGQDGWQATSTAYDQEIVSGSLPAAFGTKALRISDAVSSGSFADWVFAKPVVDGVGEADATAGTFSVGDRQTHFEASFDIATTTENVQPGLHLMVSPDRGDGSRMSYLLLEDTYNGIDASFIDAQGTSNPAIFATTQIANDLDRSEPHNVKFVMDFVDGPSNDVVKIYIDGQLVHTGTSWENYYRFDTESTAEQSPRIVKTLIFQVRGYNTPANDGKGFLVDNVALNSSVPAVVAPPPADDATITVKRVDLRGGGTCADVKVDAIANCLANGDSAEVGVAAGSHTVTDTATTSWVAIYCITDGRLSAHSYTSSLTVNANEGDEINCVIYSLR